MRPPLVVMTTDASLFRWRKDSTTGETSDLVTDADVLRRAADVVHAEPGPLMTEECPPTIPLYLRWLASRLESEPSTDGDMSQP